MTETTDEFTTSPELPLADELLFIACGALDNLDTLVHEALGLENLTDNSVRIAGAHHNLWRAIAGRVLEQANQIGMHIAESVRQADMSVEAAEAILDGTCPFRLSEVMRLALALRCSPDYLLGLTPVEAYRNGGILWTLQRSSS